MAGLEDLTGGFQRFRRTPGRIHAVYLEPMRQGLLALSSVKMIVEEAVREPEHYLPSAASAVVSLHQLLSQLEAESLIRWLEELRGHKLSAMDSEAALQLQQLDANLLLYFYKLPQCEYIKQAYPLLASRVESELSAVDDTIGDGEIRRILPFLLFLAQCNPNILSTLNSRVLGQYGVPVTAVGPMQLEVILNKFVAEELGEEYFARGVTVRDLLGDYSKIVARLGLKNEGINRGNTFLISSQGTPRGFITALNEDGPNSPLYVIAHLNDELSAAIRIAERLASHLGYGAVKLHMLLEGAVDAAAAAGLYLLGTLGFSEETFAGVFVDMIGSDEAQRKAYEAMTKARLEFAHVQLSEKSMTERVSTATWTDLTVAEFLQPARRGLQDKNIKWLVLEVPGEDGREGYMFNFDTAFSHYNLIYVHGRNEEGGNGSLEERVVAAASNVADFFNGSVTRLGPEMVYGKEMPSGKAGGFGIFFCAPLRNSAVLVDANFSINDVLRFVSALSNAAGQYQVSVSVSYSGLSPEELVAGGLPLNKMSALKEVTLTNLKPEYLQNKTIPDYVDRVVIQVLSYKGRFGAPFLIDYDLSGGLPRVSITPASADLQIGNSDLEQELLRIAGLLWDHHLEMSSFDRPTLADNSARVRLVASPPLRAIGEALAELFPGSHYFKELRYRTRIKGEDLVKT